MDPWVSKDVIGPRALEGEVKQEVEKEDDDKEGDSKEGYREEMMSKTRQLL